MTVCAQGAAWAVTKLVKFHAQHTIYVNDLFYILLNLFLVISSHESVLCDYWNCFLRGFYQSLLSFPSKSYLSGKFSRVYHSFSFFVNNDLRIICSDEDFLIFS